MSAVACAFSGINGEMIALKDVSISAVLRDLLADVTVHQTYRNDEQINIEAVYTFPLPADAVLLDFDIHIGNRQLKGTIVEKRAAEKKYEDAIESDDAALILEQGESVVAEVYPALWVRRIPREGRDGDEQAAFAVAAWLQRADANGSLEGYFNPPLTQRNYRSPTLRVGF
jgi:hypothetical protein